MSVTRKDIRDWLKRGIKKRARFMIVASDHFSYEYYPVFVFSRKELLEKITSLEAQSMTSTKEVYDYSISLDYQLDQDHAWNTGKKNDHLELFH